MKKIIILKTLFFLLLMDSRFFLEAENLFQKYSKLEFYLDDNLVTGLIVHSPFGEFKSSIKEEKMNFGINLNSSRISRTFPVTIKTGNLNISGIYSKLNNPLLSSPGTPFSTGISETEGMIANLPGYTSFSKPVSSFFEAAYKNQKNIFSQCKLNCLYVPDKNDFCLSLSASANFLNKKIKIKLENISGLFSYEENSSSTWFPESQYYHCGTHFCSCNQLTLHLWNFISVFSTALYESPFGDFSYIYRIDNKLTTSRFIINFSSFYNPNESKNSVLTSSEKTLNDKLQFHAGIQYKFMAGTKSPVFIKNGFQTFFDYNLSQKEHQIKLVTGSQIIGKITGIILSGAGCFIQNSEDFNFQKISLNNFSLQCRNIWYCNYFNPSWCFTYTYNPNKDFTSVTKKYKIDSSVVYKKNPSITGTAGIVITTETQNLISKKVKTGISIRLSTRKIDVTGKLSAEFDM